MKPAINFIIPTMAGPDAFPVRWCFIVGALSLAMLVLAGCGGSGEQKSENLAERKINVVTTTGMITDAVREVGGDRVQVTGLMGPGVDPHLYKASAGDVSRMQKADIIFYNGLHLEGAMAELFEKMSGQTKTVAVAEGIDDKKLLSPPEFEGLHDPHVWFDVSLWMKVVDQIEEALTEIDLTHADRYKVNSEKYQNRLDSLHRYVQEQADRVPETARVIVTAHDAFNYFGRAYGFRVRGLQGISTATEAGTRDVQDLADFIAENKIPAIFIETSVPRRAIEALQAAVRAKGHEVSIGGELFSDAMGDPDSSAGNYIGMVKHNIDTIVRALGGESGEE